MAKHILTTTDWAKKVLLFSTEGLPASKLVKAFYPFIRSRLFSKLKRNNALIEIITLKKEMHIMHLYLEENIPPELFKKLAKIENIDNINFKPIINREFVTTDGKIGLIGLAGFAQHSDSEKARDYISNCDYINVPPGCYHVSIYPLFLSEKELANKYKHFYQKIKNQTDAQFGEGVHEKVQNLRKKDSRLLSFIIYVAIFLTILKVTLPFLPENSVAVVEKLGSINIILIILAITLIPYGLFQWFYVAKRSSEEKFISDLETDIVLEHFPSMVATMYRVSDKISKL
ncbi:hypothetical protein [Neisseria sp. Ec49-e6-T10]|uniref:hypothetical protein n=1 Tax=Neisseria sp. Ec49-e6-T10 TaxID=3140744 RepID=UPI003EBE6ADE